MMAKDTFLNRKVTLNSKGKLIDLTTPSVMAIINLTPDSFFKESRAQQVDEVLKKVEFALLDGAKFIDLGAYSSRPGAADITVDEELKRLIPSVEAISKNFPEALISIDTFRSKIAEEGISAGAHLINDISAGELDGMMFATVAKLKVPYIMMHMKGNPQTMQNLANYGDLLADIHLYFVQKIESLKNLGVKDIILDPGFGFAKTISQNYELLKNLRSFTLLELPILVGLSRKSMITKVLNTAAADALNGTTVLNTIGLINGANILRVHDVRAAMDCIKLTEMLNHP